MAMPKWNATLVNMNSRETFSFVLSHRRRDASRPWRWLILLPIAFPSLLNANPISRQSIPSKWIEPLAPENLPEPEYRQYYDGIDKAKAQLAAGEYRRVLVTLRTTVKTTNLDSALIKARALNALGQQTEALAAVSEKDLRFEPRAVAERSTLLIELDRPGEALDALKPALAAAPSAPLLHWALGQAYEAQGDMKSAQQAYAWFVEKPQDTLNQWAGNPAKFDNAEELTAIASALDRWAALSGAYRDNVSLHETIYAMFTRAYDVVDRTYMPARVAAAAYAMSHDEDHQAQELLQGVLSVNARDIEALKLMGRLMINAYNFDGADAMIEHIRTVDDNSAAADLLESRNLMQQRRPMEAEVPIRRVLDKTPKNLEALGLLAATFALRLDDAQTKATLKQVEQIDPDNATAYFEVAEQLGAMRQYPRAAAMYQIAIDRAPNWMEPRNGLGLLHTQSGDEDAARTVLEAARSLDPFNTRTTNYLRLLDDMASYARKETPHFIILYDAATDPIIPEYFGDYLESVYTSVCSDFKHEPPDKTIIEVFPTHDAFSVRTTGAPWIGTVGASTGRVIAMVAPRRGKKTMGPFNWASVLRHEFTHTVTLAATDNRIQHWFTEGLAVQEEYSPLQWPWVPMLYHAVKTDTLFPMDELTWAFVRPKKPSDRQLAYAQSFWICVYIEQKYGHEMILKMLDEYRKAGRQEDVFPKLTGRTLSQFFDDFRAWAQQQVSTWGYDPVTTAKVDALKEEGESLIKARQYPQAVKIWEQIALLRPMDALPHQRLAGLYLTKSVNEPQKAIDHLIALHKVELKDNRYAKRIARLYRDMGKMPEARHFALQAVYVDPYDANAHELLLELSTGDAKVVEREKRAIADLKKLDAEKENN
jgi:tetratricopeptide (TPR) repeat protein